MTEPPFTRELGDARAQVNSLAGFEHIRHHWDPTLQRRVAKILPGEYYVTGADEIVMTVLGSCVSACIRDTVFGIGGMNHFMLPGDGADDGAIGEAARYGSYAMECLVNTILKHGGSRRRLEVKVFGGGQVLAQATNIGKRNVEFVMDYLHAEGLPVAASDCGDVHPRKVLYYPTTGKVRVKKLRDAAETGLVARELDYLADLRSTRVAGEIELF